ncbi:MAG: HAMP domain-containing protein [Anaerolineales bacterium]|nr:HAMP domain-containing protein [Anaerolineales bacterium]MCB9128240.1 HAMP domain-containing protein [Ardenticatenales bacterium]
MKQLRREPRSLQLRFALLFGTLLVVLTTLLLLFLNLTSRLVLLNEASAISEPPPSTTQAIGQATPTPIAMPAAASDAKSLTPTLLVPETALQRLVLLSLIGFVLIVGVGAMSSYWLAGHALHPVRAVSQHAHRVSAGTLDQRLEIANSTEELLELTSSFNRMLERLEEGFERERRFVSDAAHELQTPLAALRLNLEIVSNDPNATLQDYSEMGQTLNRAIDQLEQLVADLLLLTTGESARTFSPVMLLPLIEQLLGDLAPTASSRSIVLNSSGYPERTVEGNALLLQRVFANIIENAIHYSPQDSVVEILIEERESRVVIAVADKGIGIPPAEQTHIFERFYRTDTARMQRQEGSGLGLSLAKHIVELHGGTIHVESALNAGSVFIVTLPTTSAAIQPSS